MAIELHPNPDKPSFTVRVELPNTCPVCHHKITPALVNSDLYGNANRDSYTCVAVYVCNSCAHLFAEEYSLQRASSHGEHNGFKRKVYPTKPPETVIDMRVEKLSPRFAELYREAELAVTYGLTQSAGMCYRKALEVLVKDALIRLYNQNEETIVKMSLHAATHHPELGPKISRTADQARVIGNEYAHYEAKYEGYDLATLQKLLQITVAWIQLEIDTAEIVPLPAKS